MPSFNVLFKVARFRRIQRRLTNSIINESFPVCCLAVDFLHVVPHCFSNIVIMGKWMILRCLVIWTSSLYMARFPTSVTNNLPFMVANIFSVWPSETLHIHCKSPICFRCLLKKTKINFNKHAILFFCQIRISCKYFAGSTQ